MPTSCGARPGCTASSITDTRDARHSPGRSPLGSQHLHLTQHHCARAPSTPSEKLPGKRQPQTPLRRTRRSVGARRVARRSLGTTTHQDPLIAIGPSFGE